PRELPHATRAHGRSLRDAAARVRPTSVGGLAASDQARHEQRGQGQEGQAERAEQEERRTQDPDHGPVRGRSAHSPPVPGGRREEHERRAEGRERALAEDRGSLLHSVLPGSDASILGRTSMDAHDEAKFKAATTYDAAADAYDDTANTFWERFG